MQQGLIISESIVVNASPATVWDALINPAIRKDYLVGNETVTDWQIGSDIVFQGEYEGPAYRDKGVILENILEKQLIYSYWSGVSGLEDIPENRSAIIYLVDKITEMERTVN